MNIDRLIMQQLSGVHSSSLFFSVWRQNVHYIWCKIEKSAFIFIHLGVFNIEGEQKKVDKGFMS